MKKHWIKNFDELAVTENRKLALLIAEAGFDAINTREVILNSIKLNNEILSIQGNDFDLKKFKKIKVVGFGKASCEGALALEEVLGSKINEGVVIGLQKTNCEYIETFTGTHPMPSQMNILPGKKIFETVNNSDENDLIIAIISGGGSALLCYPESECPQGIDLYGKFLESGKTINEINSVRRHLSLLKGGGLAKIAYPATIIGLVFSDVPGTNFQDVASGPTYKDDTTIKDIEKIVRENNLGNFDLFETPKDDKYFEKVYNFVLVSNKIAIKAMDEKAKEFGFKTKIISTELYDDIEESIHKILRGEDDNTVVLAAGEPKLIVKKEGGMGGRNLHMALQEIKLKIIDNKSVFISIASDGMDNSDAAGAIVDEKTIKDINRLEINVDNALDNFNSYPVFKKSGDMIMTGPTGANVSDLMILLTRK